MPSTTPDRRLAPPSRAALLDLWAQVLAGKTGVDAEEAVVRELAEHFDVPVDEVRVRCGGTKRFSREAWLAEDRSTPDALVRYWNSMSPVFGITMSHVRQLRGEHPAACVDVAWDLRVRRPTWLLDFGCGPGTSAMFFAQLGWEVTAADVSTTMVDFARWRAARRGIDVEFLDTSVATLPVERFDVVTAFEVMAHVPDVPATLRSLRASMLPGGLLVFNVFAPPRSDDTFSHLYDANWPVVRHVRRAGFKRHPKIGQYYCYERIDRGRLAQAGVVVADTLRYNRVVTFVGNRVRAVRRAVAARTRSR